MSNCRCGAKLDIRAQFGLCQPCRKLTWYRFNAPLTLADQITVWKRWRAGDCINDIAVGLRRNPSEVRAIAFGQ